MPNQIHFQLPSTPLPDTVASHIGQMTADADPHAHAHTHTNTDTDTDTDTDPTSPKLTLDMVTNAIHELDILGRRVTFCLGKYLFLQVGLPKGGLLSVAGVALFRAFGRTATARPPFWLSNHVGLYPQHKL